MTGKDNGDDQRGVDWEGEAHDRGEPSVVPGGPLDCQDCGEPQGRQLSAGFVKREGGKMYIAALCPDCMVARMGLEWREMVESTIVMPSGMRPS